MRISEILPLYPSVPFWCIVLFSEITSNLDVEWIEEREGSHWSVNVKSIANPSGDRQRKDFHSIKPDTYCKLVPRKREKLLQALPSEETKYYGVITEEAVYEGFSQTPEYISVELRLFPR